MARTTIERIEIALWPFLHHGLDTYPDIDEEAARAVLTAMRGPTEAVRLALEHSRFSQAVDTDELWQLLIDAALGERP